MATRWYGPGLLAVLNGTIDIDTTALKVMLLKSTYTFDPDHQFVSSLTEISGVSGYTGGFNGAGRKSATVTADYKTASDRVDIAVADLTWTALGTGDTIGGAALIREITNDAASLAIAFFDFTDLPTNGSDVTLDFATLAAGGNLEFTV